MQAIGAFPFIPPFNAFTQDFEQSGGSYLFGSRPFSFYLLCAATAIGTVAAVAAFALQYWPYVFLCLAISGTTFLGAYQINMLVLTHEVESNVAAFEDNLESLGAQNSKLKYLLDSLKKVINEHFNEEFEGILEACERNEELSSTIRQMDSLTAKMQCFIRQRKEIQSFNEKFLQDLQQFSESALNIQQSSLQSDQRLQDLLAALSNLSRELHFFQNGFDVFEENSSLYMRLNDAADQMWEHMRSYLQVFHSLKDQIILIGETVGSKAMDIAHILEQVQELLDKMSLERKDASGESERSSKRILLVNNLLENL